MNAIRFFLTISLFPLLASCSLTSSESDSLADNEGVYDGIYLQGIEDAWFKPCLKPDESWIFTEVPDTLFYPSLMSAVYDEGFNPIYLKLRGVPSEKGQFSGFFAVHDRQFQVKELVEIRKADNAVSGC